MEIIKVGLVIAAGLGSTWMARETTDVLFGPPQRHNLMQAEEAKPDAAPAPDAGAAPPPTVPEMSREEMEAELKRAQDEIAGKPGASELEEFRPSKPLPADLPISMPSDI